jgi:hypothetical protein
MRDSFLFIVILNILFYYKKLMNQTYIAFYLNRGKPQYHWRLLIYFNEASIS